MSVDKFGRSSASIARRPLHLPPSRRQLQSAGALCRTGDYVDFKSALARNIASPMLPSDATSKEYVDQSVEQVQIAAQKSVQDSIEQIVVQTHALTVEYLNQHLTPLNAELIQAKADIKLYQFNASSGEQSAKRERNDLRQQVTEIKESVTKMLDRIFALENKVDHRIEKLEETVPIIRDRIFALESTQNTAASSRVNDLKPSKPKFVIGEVESISELDTEDQEINRSALTGLQSSRIRRRR